MQPTAEQFTEKAWATIVSSQQLAQSQRHQQIETEHLLLALLQQNGLANRILEKAGASPPELEAGVEQHLKQLPALQHRPESVYLGKGLSDGLDRADSLKQSYGDSYISIEHLLLSRLSLPAALEASAELAGEARPHRGACVVPRRC